MEKKIVILTLTAIFLLIGFALYSSISQDEDNTNFVEYKELNMDAQTRTLLETRLSEATKQVNDIQDGTTTVEKYNRYLLAAGLYNDLGFYRKSKEMYDNALELFPNEYNTWSLYSHMLAGAEDYAGALEAIDKAIALSPAGTDFWKWKITLEKDRLNAGYDRINGLYVDSLVKTGNHIDIMTSYAQYQEEQGNLQVAKEYWLKAIESNPSGKEAYGFEIERIDMKLNEQK